MDIDIKLSKLVVRIDCDGDLGTAFLINKNILLTAYHVIKKYNEQNVKIKIFFDTLGMKSEEATVIDCDEESDVAILKLNVSTDMSGFLEINALKISEDMKWRSYTCFEAFQGTGNIFEKELIRGNVYQNEKTENKKYDIHLDGEYLDQNWNGAFEGCSGSPLIINGYIVGIIVKEENSPRKSPLKAISIYKIQDYLKKNNIDIKRIPVVDTEKYNFGDRGGLTKLHYVPIAKTDNFYGRKNKIEEINNRFNNQNMVVIKGMSGVGKTQLTIQYLEKYKSDYDLIYFIRADRRENIVNDYLMLAKDLNINVNEEDIQQTIRNVIYWLNNNEKWIIVFDNANDSAEIIKYIPISYNGKIVVTTKNLNWIKNEPIILEEFTEDEATNFLLEITKQKDEKNSRNLAILLGKLPLALVQAAAYMEVNDISLNDYVKLYNTYKLDLFDENYIPDEYSNELKIVWKISLDQIRKDSLISIEIINLLSFLDSNGIPINFIKDNLILLNERLEKNIDILLYNKAIKILKMYSLLNISDKYISVHCLIQASVKDELKEVEEIEKYIYIDVALMNSILPNTLEETKKWENVVVLVPHAYSIVQNIEEYKIDEEVIIDLLYKVALILRVHIQLDEAKERITQCISIAERYHGKKSIKVEHINNLLAGILKDIGEWEEAEQIYEECIEVLENESGEFDSVLARTKNNLALIKLNCGKYYEAIKLFDESKELSYLEFEFNKGFIATILSNMSIGYCALKEIDTALECVHEAIELSKEKYGENSVNFARCVNNLGYILYTKGDYNIAKTKYEEALKIDEKFYGEEHPEVARKKSNLASCLIKTGDIDYAEELIKECIKINELSYGEESIQKADELNSLGMIFKLRGDTENAVIKYKEALYMAKNILGDIHPSVRVYTFNLAIALEEIGERDEVLKLYKEALNIDKKIYNKSINFIIEDLEAIGGYLYKKGDYKNSKLYAFNCLKINERLYGSISIEVALNMNLLGMIYYDQCIYDKAYEYYDKALNIHSALYNEDNENIALDYNNIAMALYQLKGIPKAKEYIKKAMDICTNNLSIKQETLDIVKNNFNIINDTIEYDFLEMLKKLKIELIECGDTLIINAHKKNN
ncbi:FxSxx-COOH system tetratricopeptide repeat protein [Clostridium sp. C2-6-12]|uniref:FxSxx-COOH system tetratricopeptide repeat protein n=1 Tax=Clostridium sp. C2-6-12 TaxID=2698832 RepID=UPI00136C901D|nr:FxSxx-COOH system tetratricopeptide repeat protein [Clostridium sp. C2-6-12]